MLRNGIAQFVGPWVICMAILMETFLPYLGHSLWMSVWIRTMSNRRTSMKSGPVWPRKLKARITESTSPT